MNNIYNISLFIILYVGVDINEYTRKKVSINKTGHFYENTLSP